MDIEIAELVERFDRGDIRLPLMQRDYVWRAKKVVRLLDSLYREWPIGSFYVWKAESSHAAKPSFGGKALGATHLDGFCGFLLDGQQRLTSLSLAIKNEGEAELQHRAFFDLENEQFFLGNMKKTLDRRVENCDPLLLPLSELLSSPSGDGAAVLKVMDKTLTALAEQNKLGKNHRNKDIFRERLYKLGKMLKHKAICEEFRDELEENAFELFSRLNKGGTSLSSGDVAAARLASAATRKIVAPMRALAADGELRGLGLNFVFLLRCLVTVHRDNCSFSKLPQKWAEDTGEIDASWKSTEKALRATVRFVRNELGWKTRRWLPSTMALIPVVYLLAKRGKTALHGKDAAYVKRFLLVAGLRGLFRGSTETAVNSYVNAIRNSRGDLSRSAKALFDRIPKNRLYKLRKDDIIKTVGTYSPVMQIYEALLYERGARSWPSARSIRDILDEGLSNDPLAVHHIFPKKFMQDRDVPIERLNTVANYAIISQPDNAELGDQDPFDVWRGLKQNQKDCASQQLCFVASDNFLKYQAYEEFLEYRGGKLAEQLNSFLGFGK